MQPPGQHRSPPLLLLLLLLLSGTFRSPVASDGVVVHKCCDEGYAYDKNVCWPENEYEKVVNRLRVPKYTRATDEFVSHETEEISFDHEKVQCPRGFKQYFSKNHDYAFRITETGTLENTDGNRLDFLKLFCLEKQLSRESLEFVVIVCTPPNPVPQYMVCMMISLLFLIATFLVFAFTTELRNLHGKFIMCYTATLCVAYASCIAQHIYIGRIIEKNFTCIFLTCLQHFCFLASFCWFTAMSFELWWSFNIYRPNNANNNNNKKLVKYSIYVWGFATGITLLTVLTNSALSNQPGHQFNIEYHDCWFSSFEFKMFWFYVIIHTVLVTDLFMFLHISLIIYKYISRSQKLAKVGYFKEKFKMYLKLFIVITISLEIEMISWLNIQYNNKVTMQYQIHDFGSALQGILIFTIFVGNGRVLNLLNRRFFKKNPQHIKRDTNTTIVRARSVYCKPKIFI